MLDTLTEFQSRWLVILRPLSELEALARKAVVIGDTVRRRHALRRAREQLRILDQLEFLRSNLG